MADAEPRPVKKRRFFVDDEPAAESLTPKSTTPSPPAAATPPPPSTNDFDVDTLTAVIGEDVPSHVIQQLRQASDGNLEKAINIYLDGSWKTLKPSPTHLPKIPAQSIPSHPGPSIPTNAIIAHKPTSGHKSNGVSRKKYIGAFGVTGWATRSGFDLLKYGEPVRIERAKSAAPSSVKTGRGGRLGLSKRQDIVVRFTNQKGEEVGRLETDYAIWLSTLIDQNICSFEGSCVYAPHRIRINDNIFLQLRCYFWLSAFENLTPIRLDTNRPLGPFESQESSGERELRLRQVGLIKLFDEIKLKPVRLNEQDEKHKRDALLEAAEMEEQQNQPVPVTSHPQTLIENSTSTQVPPDEPEEGQELQQDQLDMLYKKAQTFDFNTPESDPPDTFALTLRRYQKQALNWMLKKEKNQKLQDQSIHPLWDEYLWPVKDVDDKDLVKIDNLEFFYINSYSGEMSLEFPVQEQGCLGGILADEMGLGKTIEMISLVHSHQSSGKMDADSASSSSILTPGGPATIIAGLHQMPNAYQAIYASMITLVVAPMSLISQWQSEVERASTPGSVKAVTYYGADRSIDLRGLALEAERTRVPVVMITSYGTVLSEYSPSLPTKPNTKLPLKGLFSLHYFRVILDEAHSIKNRLSKTAKACFGIQAKHRWVLTGTPIVNRLEDLFSLVHFLNVEPWSNFSYWKTFITVPFEAKDFIRSLDVVQTVLEPLVMRRTKDMKTPTGEPLVPLPPRHINVESIMLSKNEREFYNCIFTRAKQTFNERAESGTLLKSYATIFAQILRLRQSCCHPILTRKQNIVAEEEDAAVAADIAKGLADDMDLDALLEKILADGDSEEQDTNNFGANVLRQIQDESNTECPICTEEPMNDQAVTVCWHSACKQCMLDYIESQNKRGKKAECFNCKTPIEPRDVFEVIRHDDAADSTPNASERTSTQSTPPAISLRRIGCDGSAKISALLEHLRRTRRQDPTIKSVVFSQFTSFLDLIEKSLQRDRINFLRFDGTMQRKQRAEVIEAFTTPLSLPEAPSLTQARGPTVLLLSLRAGGVGLNLTAAQHVYMMDPWWSFAVEAQAIDRVHRMGQERGVVVTRFIVAESIEEKMLRIQERKKFIATTLGMMSNDEKKLQRIEDIKELLS